MATRSRTARYRCTGATAELSWRYTQLMYSLTIPQEAIAAALLVVLRSGYTATMRLLRPEDNFAETLRSGVTSAFADVPTEEAAELVLEVSHQSRATNYTILVLRSTITSNFKFRLSDPAASASPLATLTGLSVLDGQGPLPMRPMYFDPQRSQYLAFAQLNTGGRSRSVRLVASKNDPNATLRLRVDGTQWEPLESGIRTRYIEVPRHAWLQVEIEVASPTTAVLVYEILITRELLCHVMCRTCYGPKDTQCLSCRAPLLLNNGSCSQTACPPGKYYDWTTYQCQPCHETCAQCEGPASSACTQCPALYLLSPPVGQEDARMAPCVLRCSTGRFAHPKSRRCRKPPTAPVKSFYLQFKFRSTFEAFAGDALIQESVVNTTAFVLGLSLSDVRAYRLEPLKELNGIMLEDYLPQMMVEVVSPFLLKDEADAILVDLWFGAFEVPLDEVTSFTWDEVHPPLPPLPLEPFLPVWLWGLITSASSAVVMLIPLYCCYFRRLSSTRRKYRPTAGVDPSFMEKVVAQSDPRVVRRFVAREAGAQLLRDSD
ncbi:Proprotein convertase subtilisin/kexin type 5 (Proprotein convertase 5) (PC5) (Proprotein convertase 6) (PC6) (Subtilisin/kexin-like protease PC5) (rPC5) [Durusdinium trenchii]|uniref:Proprotein convertase subtilisin/kexin type 5 (Proprotein convertase 5) (PC5) (Proprotein convertase 6) (PC6) (Subtilisin/kexin-like protease PC5) (RPC5) n=1 Tax=Durusdinium trenchii TaxID=1381693 RepID=A0ABP0KMA6_9DINO